MFKKCIRCGETIGAIPGGIWVEALGGEVCLECYHESAKAAEGLQPGEMPVIPPKAPEETVRGRKGKRRLLAANELEHEDLRAIYTQLDKIRTLLMYLAILATVGVIALLIAIGK